MGENSILRNKDFITTDWGEILGGRLQRGILPTDTDGEIESNGYFHRLETKKLNERPMSIGQKGLLSAYSNEPNKTVTIIYLSNDKNDVVRFEDFKKQGIPIGFNNKDFRQYLESWITDTGNKRHGRTLFLYFNDQQGEWVQYDELYK